MSLGASGAPGEFEAAVGLLEAYGVDSLWLPENVYGPAVERVHPVRLKQPDRRLEFARCPGRPERQDRKSVV